MKIIKKILIGALLVLGLILTLGSTDSFKSTNNLLGQEEQQSLTLSYVTWDTEIASTHVIAEVLSQAGFNVNLVPLDNAIMWSSVASAEADAMVGAWLPNTHATQFEQYGDQMEDLGPNLEGAAVGLVVPTYMEDVNSIEDLSQQANQIIIGIEPGAGVVAAAEQSLKDYPNLVDWTVQTSSSGAMTTELGTAYANHEEIIVTGWSPHWKFQEYDLKYLEDPRGSFGKAESIHTFTRKGLDEDMPEAYQILENFYWEVEDMEAVMYEINSGADPQVAAQDWIAANQDRVSEWIDIKTSVE